MTLSDNPAARRDPGDFWSRAARELGGSPESLWARRLVAQASGLLPDVSTGPTGATARWLRDSILHAGADTARMGALVGAPVMDRMAHAAYPDLYRWPNGETRPPVTMADVAELIPTDPQRAADADATGREIGPLGMVLASLAMTKGPGGKDPRFKMQTPPKLGGAPAITRTPVEAAREIISRWAQRSRDWPGGRTPRWAGNRATMELNSDPVQAIQQRMIHGWNAGQEIRRRVGEVPLALGKRPAGPFYAGVAHGVLDDRVPVPTPAGWPRPEERTAAALGPVGEFIYSTHPVPPYAHSRGFQSELDAADTWGAVYRSTPGLPPVSDRFGPYTPEYQIRTVFNRNPESVDSPQALREYAGNPWHELIHRWQVTRPEGEIHTMEPPPAWLGEHEAIPIVAYEAPSATARKVIHQFGGRAGVESPEELARVASMQDHRTRDALFKIRRWLESVPPEGAESKVASNALAHLNAIDTFADYMRSPKELQADLGSRIFLDPTRKTTRGGASIWRSLQEMVNDDPQLNRRFRLLGLGGLAAGAAAGAADPENPISPYPTWVTSPPDQRE